MNDYGREPEFGASVEPLADPMDWAARIARAADRAGLDLVGIQDHPYQQRFLDTWTLIATLVPVTERVRFFPDVANLPLRQPAMLAKAVASLDVISGGRIEIGAGAFWDAIVAMGGPRRGREISRRSYKLVWSDERSLRFDGEFYRLEGMRPGPKPVHDIGIWVGAGGPRMLGLIGRLADGCEECLKLGDAWVHLRECLICGHVGCCDSSKNKHATKHFHATEHPIVKSFEPGEDWRYCYVDDMLV